MNYGINLSFVEVISHVDMVSTFDTPYKFWAIFEMVVMYNTARSRHSAWVWVVIVVE